MPGKFDGFGSGSGNLPFPIGDGFSPFMEKVLFGITLLAGLAFCSLVIALFGYLLSLLDLSDPRTTIPATMTLVVTVGYGLFVFKAKWQDFYGLVEVCFAWAVSAHFAYRLARGVDEGDQKTLAVWIGIAGACYVVARGFSNMADAKKKLARARRLKESGPQK